MREEQKTSVVGSQWLWGRTEQETDDKVGKSWVMSAEPRVPQYKFEFYFKHGREPS